MQPDIFVLPPWILANGGQWPRSHNKLFNCARAEMWPPHKSTPLGDLTGRISINYLAMWSCRGFEQRITKAPAAEKFTTIMQNTLAQTKANLEKAQEQMKVQADKHRSIAPKYQIGNKVWLSTNNLKVTCASKKLTEWWLGPYDVTKLVGDNAVRLHLPKTMCIHPVVHKYLSCPSIQRTAGRTNIYLTWPSESHWGQRNRI